MALSFKPEPIVRLFKPKVILLDFHGTISQRRWEEFSIFAYVYKNISSFVKANWYNEQVQKCLAGLRNESFEQHFRHRYEEAPIIDEEVSQQNEANQQASDDAERIAEQTGEFLLWQLKNKKETKETQIIERMVWLDGYNKKLIKTPLFDDVAKCLEQWRKSDIRIYIISSLDDELMRIFFENTTAGDIRPFITDYVSQKSGEKLIAETYSKFASDVAKVKPEEIVFITDSGQEAKAAKLAKFECLLVSRPGNRRIRAYYLTEFQYLNSFNEIVFVRQD